jgi:hypothetical protein
VMKLQPLDGEKLATLDKSVGYRVCRTCSYGFIYDIELHTSRGHGLGREIVWRSSVPTGTSKWGTTLWKPLSVGFWEQMSAELGVDLVQAGPRPANYTHACESFSLDVLQVSDIYTVRIWSNPSRRAHVERGNGRSACIPCALTRTTDRRCHRRRSGCRRGQTLVVRQPP